MVTTSGCSSKVHARTPSSTLRLVSPRTSENSWLPATPSPGCSTNSTRCTTRNKLCGGRLGRSRVSTGTGGLCTTLETKCTSTSPPIATSRSALHGPTWVASQSLALPINTLLPSVEPLPIGSATKRRPLNKSVCRSQNGRTLPRE